MTKLRFWVRARTKRLLRTNRDWAVSEGIMRGLLCQLRPVLLMVVVALLGIGSEVQRPLATVVVGGLLSTLFLTLFALPSMVALVVRTPKEVPQ